MHAFLQFNVFDCLSISPISDIFSKFQSWKVEIYIWLFLTKVEPKKIPFYKDYVNRFMLRSTRFFMIITGLQLL